MTIKDLKAHLEKFDPDMEVGGMGHFGELLSIEAVEKVGPPYTNFVFVAIKTESPGDSPE
jgi:hypothetical protein